MVGHGWDWEASLAAFAIHDAAVLGMAPPTVANHGTYLRAFARWWDAAHPGRAPTDASVAELTAFLIAEADRGIAARTRRAQIATLRHFYAWLVLTGVCATDPTGGLRAPRVPADTPEVYRPDEIRTILTHTQTLTDLRGRQRHVIVAMLRYTGMRSIELRALPRAQLDLDGGRARVIGKGGHARIVLLPEVVRTTVARFLAEVRPALPDSPLLLANAHPFVTTPHAGFSQEALAREVELAGLGAQVPGRHHPHKWRHTYATELVRAGVDIHVVQRLLGHASIASTIRYTHLGLDDLQDTLASVWPAG